MLLSTGSYKSCSEDYLRELIHLGQNRVFSLDLKWLPSSQKKNVCEGFNCASVCLTSSFPRALFSQKHCGANQVQLVWQHATSSLFLTKAWIVSALERIRETFLLFYVLVRETFKNTFPLLVLTVLFLNSAEQNKSNTTLFCFEQSLCW